MPIQVPNCTHLRPSTTGRETSSQTGGTSTRAACALKQAARLKHKRNHLTNAFSAPCPAASATTGPLGMQALPRLHSRTPLRLANIVLEHGLPPDARNRPAKHRFSHELCLRGAPHPIPTPYIAICIHSDLRRAATLQTQAQQNGMENP